MVKGKLLNEGEKWKAIVQEEDNICITQKFWRSFKSAIS
jgi:hypothetical protein